MDKLLLLICMLKKLDLLKEVLKKRISITSVLATRHSYKLLNLLVRILYLQEEKSPPSNTSRNFFLFLRVQLLLNKLNINTIRRLIWLPPAWHEGQHILQESTIKQKSFSCYKVKIFHHLPEVSTIFEG